MEFLENAVRTRKDEIEKNQAAIQKNEEDGRGVADQVQSKDSALRELENQRDLAREKYELVSGDLEEWRSEVNRLRDDMIEKMKELNDVGRRQEALQANLDRLTERITNEYSVDLANPDDIERVEYSQPEADREIRELKTTKTKRSAFWKWKRSSTTWIAPAPRSTAPSPSSTTLPAVVTWIRLRVFRRTSSSCSVSCS